MLYRSVVFLNAMVALVAGFAAAISPGWWLFQRHFARFWEVDWRLFLHAKSLMIFLGAAYLAFGFLLLAALWVREPRARMAVALALWLGNAFGAFCAMGNMAGVGQNVVGMTLLALFGFLSLAAFVVILGETIAFAVPARETST